MTDFFLDNTVFEREDWMDEGICAQTDPEEFFPRKGETGATAKRICLLCPVRERCLEYALANDQRWGVWGGTTERQRRKLKKQREQAAA